MLGLRSAVFEMCRVEVVGQQNGDRELGAGKWGGRELEAANWGQELGTGNWGSKLGQGTGTGNWGQQTEVFAECCSMSRIGTAEDATNLLALWAQVSPHALLISVVLI